MEVRSSLLYSSAHDDDSEQQQSGLFSDETITARLSGATASLPKPKEKTWRGNYCCVPLCRNSSGQQEERERLGLSKISFHSFPKEEKRKNEWIVKIKRDPGTNFKLTKHTKICSEHFTCDDYAAMIPDLPRAKPCLKANAVPSVFPWSVEIHQRTSNTSKKAAQPCDVESGEHVTDLAFVGSDLDGEEVQYDGDHFVESDIKDPEGEIQKLKLQVSQLKLQVSQLQGELEEARNSATRSLFWLENIKDKNELVRFYTGFPDYGTLLAFYEQILESDAKVMKQWDSRRCGDPGEATDVKNGPSCKLPLLEQLFLTLVRLRLGLFETDLAVRFGLSQSSISRITTTWINLMFHSLKSLYRFPPWHIVKKYMPESFRKHYPNTRIIIDATEFTVERPSSLVSQSSTFSTYKSRNTVKVLIGIMPSGPVTFISDCYEGSISDKKLVQVSGLLEKLEPGDEIMADKGFLIQDILAPLGVRLNVPPLMKSNSQMAAEDIILTKKIAQLRIHVERAIGRIKEYHILQGVLPAAMWDTINQIVFVCCMLSNFNPPLVS